MKETEGLNAWLDLTQQVAQQLDSKVREMHLRFVSHSVVATSRAWPFGSRVHGGTVASLPSRETTPFSMVF